MKILFPNKPIESFKSQLPEFDKTPGRYLAQQKLDGYRCMIVKNPSKNLSEKSWYRKDHLFLSRRGMIKGGPTKLPVSDELLEMVIKLNLPDNTMLDSEWIARRTIGETPESLYVFDILWLNDEWMGSKNLKNRHETLIKIMSNHETEIFKIPESVENNYQNFFDKQTKIPYTEGIVLKDLNSTLIPDRSESPKNSGWIKCKWRQGHNGRETFNI